MNANRLIELAWTQFWQVTLVIAVAGVVTRTLFRNRPHWAYAVWAVALLKCLTPPVVTNPVGLFGVSPSRPGSEAAAIAERRGDAMPFTPAERRPTRARPADAAAVEVAIAPQQVPAGSRPGVNWPLAAAVVWAAGMLAVIGRALARSLAWRRRVLRAAVPTPQAVAKMADEQRLALGLWRRPRLVVVDAAVGPAVAGVGRPVVVLPLSIAKANPAAPRAALTHEFLHLRRLDPLAAAVQTLAVAAWWFHPLVWWAGRRASLAREMCCDAETVAALACDPADYGQTLLDVVRHARGTAAGPLLAMTAATAGRRIEFLTTAGQFSRRASWPCRLAAVALALLVLPAARPQQSASLGAGPARAPATGPTTGPTMNLDPNAPPTVVPPGGPIPTAGPLIFVGHVREKGTGKPIAGAIVTLMRQHAFEPARRWEDVVPPEKITTDADGKYSFAVTAEQVADKDFCLATQVSHPDYAARTWEGEGLGLTRREAAAGERPWFENIEMSPAAKVTGVVVDPAGRPLAGCQIDYRAAATTEQLFEIQQGANFTLGETKTDANGRFTFNAIAGKGSSAKIAVMPENAAPQFWYVETLGDVGTIRLGPGQRVKGQLLDEAGKPVVGAHVRIVPESTGSEAERRIETDADGRFDAPPVPAGKVSITAEDGRFLTTEIDVKADAAPAPVTMRPPEMVSVEGTLIDSAGKPLTRAYDISIFGSLNDRWYHGGRGQTVRDGRFSFRVPKGLTRAEVKVVGRAGYEMVWQYGGRGPWRTSSDTDLGPLRGDVRGLVFKEFKQPTVVLRAVDEAGKSIKFKPSARYAEKTLHKPVHMGWNGDVNSDSDCAFAEQPDGSWKSGYGLLPTFELTVTATAGDRSVGRTITLEEGETREMTLTIR